MTFLRDTLLTKYDQSMIQPLKKIEVANHLLIMERLKYLLSQVELIEISDSVQKFSAETKREDWEYEKHFDCVVPPFKLFFMESQRPTVIKSENAFMDASLLPKRWGVLFEAIGPGYDWTESEITAIGKKIKLQPSKKQWMYAVNFVVDDFVFNGVKQEGVFRPNPRKPSIRKFISEI